MDVIDWSKPLFVVGTTASAMLAGGVGYISILAIPSFLDAPTNTTLLSQWSHLVQSGTRTARTLAIVSASCHFLNAYWRAGPHPVDFANSCVQGGAPSKLVAAGITTLGILPFTYFFIRPMNEELRKRAEDSLNAWGMGDEIAARKMADLGWLTPTPGTQTPVNEKERQQFWARDKKKKLETTDLVRTWGTWNLFRAIMPLAGTWLALGAL